MNTVKAGQGIKIYRDFNVNTCISGNEINIKKGDEGYIDSCGCIHYTSGNAKGKVQNINVTVKGYDIESITNIIFRNLDNKYELNKIIADYDIELKDLKNVTCDVLESILI